jgi:hypothetical protein
MGYKIKDKNTITFRIAKADSKTDTKLVTPHETLLRKKSS